MSVNPGFGGQSFLSSQLRKIETLRKTIDRRGLDVMIEVDGGVNPADSRGNAWPAGADALVAGSAVFKGGPERLCVQEYRRAARGHEALMKRPAEA
jgi:ribulose-phosphate 3-epimerase